MAEGTVAALRRRFVERGLRETVERKAPDRQYQTKLNGEQEARLIQLACSEAPTGRSTWSLRLLADKMVELGVVDSISHETVRQMLKGRSEIAQSNSNRTWNANGSFRRRRAPDLSPRWKRSRPPGPTVATTLGRPSTGSSGPRTPASN